MNTIHQEYTYFAFISYKREDEKWAKWLQKKLESYGFPVSLRKENPSLPAKIRPIFRDQSELSGGNLKEEIEKGLAGSKYLIVICSPRAAKSPWVSKEVRYFINHERENYIVPFIIGGSPNASNPEDECFPEGLRQLYGEREILGININEMGRDAAVIKVIARMFNLRFDTLWQRHERTKRHRRITVIGCVILFAAICLSIGVYMSYLNTQIAAERDRAEIQTEIAKTERNRANNERDNALKANKALAQAKDSIQLQSDLLAKTNKDLEESNFLLTKERDNVLKANWKMMENRARFISEKALQLCNNGESYTAIRLLSTIIPYEKTDIPSVPESESALRKALECNCASIDSHLRLSHPVFSKDCRYLAASTSNNEIEIFDVKTLQSLGLLKGHTKYITNIHFSDDNEHILSSSHDGDIRIWNFCTMTCDSVLKHDYSVKDVIYSHDGRYFASCSRDNIYIWDSKNMQCHKVLKSNGYVEQIEFNNSGTRLLTLDSKDMIKEWDIMSGECTKTIYDFLAHTITYGKDSSEAIVGSLDKTIKIWNLENGNCKKVLSGHTERIEAVKFHQESNRLLSTSYSNEIKLWNLDEFKCIQTFTSNKYRPIFTFSNDGLKIAITLDGYLNILDAHNGKQIKRYPKPPMTNDLFTGMTFSPDDQSLAFTSYLNKLCLWDYNDFIPKHHIIEPHNNAIISLDINHNFILSLSNDKINITDDKNANRITEFNISNNSAKDATFDPSGNLVACVSSNDTNGVLQIFNFNTLLRTICFENQKLEKVLFRPKSNDIIISSRKSIMAYNMNSGSIRSITNIFEAYIDIISISCSPNGEFITAGLNDGSFRTWDILGKEIYIKKKAHTTEVINKVQYNSRGDIIITGGGDGAIKIWNSKRGLLLKELAGHSGYVYDVNFSHDNSKLVSCSSDGTIKIWDIKSGVVLWTIPTIGIVPSKVKFTHDDTKIITGYRNGQIIIWEFLPLSKLLQEIHSRFGSYPLNNEEKRKYYLE